MTILISSEKKNKKKNPSNASTGAAAVAAMGDGAQPIIILGKLIISCVWIWIS